MPLDFPDGSALPVGSLTLPAGSYVLSATANFVNGSDTEQASARCVLGIAGQSSTADETLGPRRALNLGLTHEGVLALPGTAVLNCFHQGVGGNLSLLNYSLTAIKVETLNQQ